MAGWFEVDRMVDITDAGGRVVGRVAPGHRYQAVEMDDRTVTILGPGGAPGFVTRGDVRVVEEGGPAGPVAPLRPLVPGQGLPPPGVHTGGASYPGSPMAPRGAPAAGRAAMIVASVLVLLVWGYDMTVNEGLPGYWLIIPVAGVVGLVCAAVARRSAGVVAIIAFAVAGLTAGYEAAVSFGPSLDAGTLLDDLRVDLAFVVAIPLVFVLSVFGMVTGGIMARSRA